MGADRRSEGRLDGVEIKVTMGRDAGPLVMKTLDLDPDRAARRNIYFCELADGAGSLLDQRIIVRLRENIGDDADSTVKFRPFEPRRLTDRWRKTKKFAGGDLKVEADWVGERPTVSLSVGAKLEAGDAAAAAAGLRPLASLFSPTQLEFLAEHAVDWVELPDLRVLGPIDAMKWGPTGMGFSLDVTAEHWKVDVLEFLELSVRVDDRDDAPEARQAFMSFLDAEGLLDDVVHETKTRTVLDHLAGRS